MEAVLEVVSPTPDVSLLKEEGRLALAPGVACEGAGRFNVMALPTPANVQPLAALLEKGALRVPIKRSFGFE